VIKDFPLSAFSGDVDNYHIDDTLPKDWKAHAFKRSQQARREHEATTHAPAETSKSNFTRRPQSLGQLRIK
jgi:hypothetical protein